MSQDQQAQFINPPHSLNKAKTGDGPGRMDPDLLAAAEDAMKELGASYAGWVMRDIDAMTATLAAMAKGEVPTGVRDLHRGALDIKGQGGSFGYALLTAIGGSLADFLEPKDGLSTRDVEVVTAHLDAMRVVVRRNVKGDGGAIGREIVAGLRRATG